jgi:hypothetical protein
MTDIQKRFHKKNNHCGQKVQGAFSGQIPGPPIAKCRRTMVNDNTVTAALSRLILQPVPLDWIIDIVSDVKRRNIQRYSGPKYPDPRAFHEFELFQK